MLVSSRVCVQSSRCPVMLLFSRADVQSICVMSNLCPDELVSSPAGVHSCCCLFEQLLSRAAVQSSWYPVEVVSSRVGV